MRRWLLAVSLVVGISVAFAQPWQGSPVGPNNAFSPSVTVNGQTCTLGSSCSGGPITSQIEPGTRDLTTASGTQTISGFGFTPSTCDGFGSVAVSSTLQYVVFAAHSDSSGNQGSLIGDTQYAVNNANFFIASDGTNQQAATIAYGSGSVTLTWTKTGSPTGTFSFSIRCFK